jgi:hypothetical protein
MSTKAEKQAAKNELAKLTFSLESIFFCLFICQQKLT